MFNWKKWIYNYEYLSNTSQFIGLSDYIKSPHVESFSRFCSRKFGNKIDLYYNGRLQNFYSNRELSKYHVSYFIQKEGASVFVDFQYKVIVGRVNDILIYFNYDIRSYEILENV